MNNENKYECRNAMYFKANDYSGDDIVVVKEYIHQPDGVIKPNLRIIPNFKKPVYIHKPAFRTYQQKKVWKPIREMDIKYTTEAKLDETLKRALGIPLGAYKSRREICRSPYVYGTDISTTSIIKKMYKDKYPKLATRSSVAVLDIETRIGGEEEIIAVALSFKDKAIVVTTEGFLGTTQLAEEKFYKRLDELTPEVRKTRGVNVEFKVCKTPGLALIEIFKKAHEWKPDFIAGWNLLAYDLPRIIQAFEKEGMNPADWFSDPSIPPRFRKCQLRMGPTQRTSADGVHFSLAGYEQWHWLDCPASFYFLDSMCLYYQIRKGGPNEEDYKLDTILNKHIGDGKVKIKEAEHLSNVDWHRFMQSDFKIEYLVYNLWDCVGLEKLDEKTGDISTKFCFLVGISDFCYYTSNPRRLLDNIHFFALENEEFKGVIGTASDQLRTELDKYVPSRKGWIVTLPTERLLNTSLDIIKEIPGLETKMHGQSADLDVASGYPNIEISMNMSKETTVHELTEVQGLYNEDVRVLGLNILGGKANSIGFARKVYDLPRPSEMYDEFLKEAS